MDDGYVKGDKEVRITCVDYKSPVDAILQLGENLSSEADIIAARNGAGLLDRIWSMAGWTNGLRFIASGDNPHLLLKYSVLPVRFVQQAADAIAHGRVLVPDSDVYRECLSLAERQKRLLPEQRTVLVLPVKHPFVIQPANVSMRSYFGVLRFLAEDLREAQTYLANMRSKDLAGVYFGLPKRDHSEPFLELSRFNQQDFDGSESCASSPRSTKSAFGTFPASN